jgi:hypothetical protein
MINGHIVKLIKETDIIYFFHTLAEKKDNKQGTLSGRTKEKNKWLLVISKG